jgi:hypothetical protein
MLTLNKRQLDHLQHRLDHEVRDLDTFLSKLIEKRRQGFGGVSDRLGWDTASAMLTDQLCAAYQYIIDMATGKRENSATLESLERYYNDAFERWDPQHSTNPVSNLENEQKLAVIKRIREDLGILKHLADSGEATT